MVKKNLKLTIDNEEMSCNFSILTNTRRILFLNTQKRNAGGCPMTKTVNTATLPKLYAEKSQELTKWIEKSATDMHSIHEMRRCLKYLYACFDLAVFISPQLSAHQDYYHRLKKIFKAAGMTREAQINKSVFEEHHVSGADAKDYLRFLKAQKQEGKKKLKKAIRHFDAKEAKRTEKEMCTFLKNMNEKLLLEYCTAYIHAQAGKIDRLLKLDNSSTVLHNIRKHIKSAGSVLHMMSKAQPGRGQAALLRNIEETEKCIGQWHDKRVLLDSLKQFIKKTGGEDGSPKLGLFTKHLKKEEGLLRRQLKTTSEGTVRLLLGL